MKRTILVRLLASAFILSALTSPALAQSSNRLPVTEYIIRKGEHYLEQGDFMRASHEFGKALLIDPNNQKARYYLDDINVGAGTYVRPKTLFDDYYSLSAEVDEQRSKVFALERKHAREKQKRLEAEEANRQLRQELAREREEKTEIIAESRNSVGRSKQFAKEIRSLEHQLASAKVEWGRERMVLLQEAEGLEEKLNQIQQQRKTAEDTIEAKRSLQEQVKWRVEEIRRRAEGRMAADRALIKKLQLAVREKNSAIVHLRKELYADGGDPALADAIRQRIETEQQDADAMEERTEVIAEELNAQTIEDEALAKSLEAAAEVANREVAVLKRRLSRLTMREERHIAMIRERDEKIESLKSQLAEAREQAAAKKEEKKAADQDSLSMKK